MLEAAGVPLEIFPAEIDERAIEKNSPGAPDAVAGLLAIAKAQAVAAVWRQRIVVAADQTLSCGGRRFSKPLDRDCAREQLLALRGKTHELHASAAVQFEGNIVFEHVDTARLTMRDFSRPFLEGYLDRAGAAVCASVGGYQLEGLGVQLFDHVEGDYFTILGLPLLPLLGFFRRQGWLAA